MKRAYPKALNFLEGLVCEGKMLHGGRLPPIKELAGKARVSCVTMWKAVRELKRRGVLSVGLRRGIHLISSEAGSVAFPAEEAAPFRPTQRWERLVTEIERDILDGTFRSSDPLPSLKVLAARYGVCYETLRKALNRLEQSGSITPFKKGYTLPAVSVPTALDTVVLVACMTEGGRMLVSYPRTQQYMQTLENECTKRSLNFAVFSYNRDVDRLDVPAPWQDTFSSPGRKNTILGFMVLPTPLQTKPIQNILLRLLPFNKPIAILDEGGYSPEPPRRDARRGLVRVFTIANTTMASHQVARHLLTLGHRKIAFISPTNKAPWSRNRFIGLKRAFDEAGIADGVCPCTYDQYVSGREFVETTREEEIRDKLDSLLRNAAWSSHSQKTMESMLDYVGKGVLLEVMREKMIPLFERALERSEITAWVACNDHFAFLCLDHLQDKGICVPRDISLVGFDDCTEAFTRNLASYNFDGPTVIRNMLMHILDPVALRRLHRGAGPMEVRGFLSRRETLGKAGRSGMPRCTAQRQR